MNNEDKQIDIFSSLIGHEYAKSLLKSIIKTKQLAPAYMFHGPEGIGKKKSAELFLEGLMTGGLSNTKIRRRLIDRNHSDLLWIEPTYIHQGKLFTKDSAEKEHIKMRSVPQIRLEQIKAVQNFLGRHPLEAHSGMVVIEDVENINEAAANALLKTLEEPKKGFLILISHRPELLLDTIHSRCQKIPFSRLNKENFQYVIGSITEKSDMNNIPVQYQEEILSLANGSPGEYLKHMKISEEIEDELWLKINSEPKKSLDCLLIAKKISEELNSEQQAWLISWMQQNIWIKKLDAQAIKELEDLRIQLKSFVQPRLAWEVALLKLNKIKQ